MRRTWKLILAPPPPSHMCATRRRISSLSLCGGDFTEHFDLRRRSHGREGVYLPKSSVFMTRICDCETELPTCAVLWDFKEAVKKHWREPLSREKHRLPTLRRWIEWSIIGFWVFFCGIIVFASKMPYIWNKSFLLKKIPRKSRGEHSQLLNLEGNWSSSIIFVATGRSLLVERKNKHKRTSCIFFLQE